MILHTLSVRVGVNITIYSIIYLKYRLVNHGIILNFDSSYFSFYDFLTIKCKIVE